MRLLPPRLPLRCVHGAPTDQQKTSETSSRWAFFSHPKSTPHPHPPIADDAINTRLPKSLKERRSSGRTPDVLPTLPLSKFPDERGGDVSLTARRGAVCDRLRIVRGASTTRKKREKKQPHQNPIAPGYRLFFEREVGGGCPSPSPPLTDEPFLSPSPLLPLRPTRSHPTSRATRTFSLLPRHFLLVTT